MILINFLSDGSLTGFMSGPKKLLERQLSDTTALVDNFDTSLPLACYVYDPESNNVSLRSDWGEIKQLEDNNIPLSMVEVENRQKAKELEIKEQALAWYSQPVSYQDGTQWRGGQSSASSIQGAIELAKSKGLSELTLRDAERAPRTYTIAEAEQIALAIGSDYEAKFQAKEDALYALAQIDLEAEGALEQINGITLEVPDV